MSSNGQVTVEMEQKVTESTPLTAAAAPAARSADSAKFELLTASSKNDVNKIRELMSEGVDPSAVDYDNRSAVHVAASQGHMEAIDLLIEAKANLGIKDSFGFSPLDEALRNGHHQVAQKLRDNGAVMISKQLENDLIALAAGHTDLVPAEQLKKMEDLLMSGLDPNCCDYDLRTPLHLAVAENNVPMTKLLLKFKANPNNEDRWGGTPAKEARRRANARGLNEMGEIFSLMEDGEEKSPMSLFSGVFTVVQIIMIILFFFCTEYSSSTGGGDAAYDEALGDDSMRRYPAFQDVNVMIFIGFGYLMTFLRKNAYNSLGLTFLVSVLCIQWHILCGNFMVQAFHGGSFHKIGLSLETLILADFATGAVLITYGALLGKVSPFQLLFIAMVEIVFFSINEEIGIMLGITDIGGSMVVHMFGAYFGLGVSRMLRDPKHSSHEKNSPSYHSDMLAMVGTVFLFMFWPSFNGAMGDGAQQQRVVVNTVLSLAGSCLCSYLASHIFRRTQKFDMVDIQNATLAGGVAMGTSADMLIGPGGALLTGGVAGVVSVLGYVYVQPFLESKLGVHDTCGVHNLHGIPSIIGASAGAIVTSLATLEAYGPKQLATTFGSVADGSRTAEQQASIQAVFIFITLAMSLGCGAFTGLLVKALSCCMPPIVDEGEKQLFSDEGYWEVPHLEEPFYFDQRGEITRGAGGGADSEQRMGGLEEQLKALSTKMEREQKQAAQAPSNSGLEAVFGKILAKLN